MLICDYCEEKITEPDQIESIHGTVVTCCACAKIMENNHQAFKLLSLAIRKIALERNKDEEWIRDAVNCILSDIWK